MSEETYQSIKDALVGESDKINHFTMLGFALVGGKRGQALFALSMPPIGLYDYFLFQTFGGYGNNAYLCRHK